MNFGHPPALVFSAESRKFVNIYESRMVQFLPLGLQIPRITQIEKSTTGCSFARGI